MYTCGNAAKKVKASLYMDCIQTSRCACAHGCVDVYMHVYTVRPSVRPSVCMSVCLSVRRSFCLPACLSICLYLFIRVSVCVCPFVLCLQESLNVYALVYAKGYASM